MEITNLGLLNYSARKKRLPKQSLCYKSKAPVTLSVILHKIEASLTSTVLQSLPLNRLIASSVTGSKRLTRFPSGSRNNTARFPHGIVVGSFTHSSTNGFKRS